MSGKHAVATFDSHLIYILTSRTAEGNRENGEEKIDYTLGLRNVITCKCEEMEKKDRKQKHLKSE